MRTKEEKQNGKERGKKNQKMIPAAIRFVTI
jgi:hypothetical protein